jgi:L-methionine (R)-S-oxide reductase
MAEDLNIISGTKTAQYESLIPQIVGLLEGETDLVANLANVVASLKQQFGWLWVGFYVVKPALNEASAGRGDELVFGPFQGPVACTRIEKGKGVCGTCWQQAAAIIVPDIEEFPGHIACSSLSKSEIVIPVICNGEVVAVLDVDSEQLDHFDATDKFHLEKIAELIPF